jgi:hypothetical protein
MFPPKDESEDDGTATHQLPIIGPPGSIINDPPSIRLKPTFRLKIPRRAGMLVPNDP